MTNQELADYIQSQLDQDIDIEVIKKNLMSQGCSKEEFDQALLDIAKNKSKKFNPIIN